MHKARRRDTTRSCVYQATRAKRTRADRGLPVATKSTRKLAVLGDTRPSSIAGSLRPERNVRRLLPLPTVCRLASLPPRISDPVVGKKERKRQAEAHLHPLAESRTPSGQSVLCCLFGCLVGSKVAWIGRMCGR